MAESFGVVSGAVGIATAFKACIDCFEYIKLGRRFGRDFQTSQLALNCTRLRLSRWGEAVHIYDDPYLGRPNATLDELQNAKSTLFQILCLFEDSAAISRKYQLDPKHEGGDELAEFSAGELEPVSASLNNKMRALAIRRQKGASILKTTKWALFDGSEFKRLIENITLLTGNLETMFPAPQQQANLVSYEIQELEDEQQLKLLAGVAQGVDGCLQRAANEALTGHRYQNIQIRGKALNGDAFDQNWRHGAIGAFHTYDGVVVEQGAKAINGNQYGGTSFWDD
ncbi:prion-inhibition and propagation-domain-containing protein [Parachaetomium inaequale]|uniref:Prion-inhibition and propagation-domain-containing protein n=1 Tax=Parachaetomium inaequale TaxID=2588326 RepID=A0AAN6PGB9_9PEZI|nr:prion-inhibition and propagation-domain-containing protein [Parachaetomium inaequale]